MLEIVLGVATIAGGLAAVWFFVDKARAGKQPAASTRSEPAEQPIDHLYTMSPEERQEALDRLGYTDEGIAFYTASSPAPDWKPLYRLCHVDRNTHFYTADAAERDRAVADFGYRDEGVLCQVGRRRAGGSVPLLRVFHRQQSSHFYTTVRVERDHAISVLGYRNEGSVGYVFDGPGPDRIPVFRLFRAA